MSNKKCSKCNQVKFLENFEKHQYKLKSGEIKFCYRHECLECRSVYQKSYDNKRNQDKKRIEWIKKYEKIRANNPERKDYVKNYGQAYNIINNDLRIQYDKNRAEKRKFDRINNPKKTILNSSKWRAKRKNIEHNISTEDFEIPKFCPILNIELSMEGHLNNRPSIDRINNSKGYTKDNIQIISHKANRIKTDAQPNEIKQVYDFLNTM